jgi:hypothetical protein
MKEEDDESSQVTYQILFLSFLKLLDVVPGIFGMTNLHKPHLTLADKM